MFDALSRFVLRVVVPAALTATVLPASASSAAVSIGPSRIMVTSKRAEAIVDRNPFRLAVTNGAGLGLSEVPNAAPGPSLLLPTIDPLPPGTDNQVSGQLYAPLSFLVGQESITQYSGLVWGGNLLTGLRTGMQYAARTVTGAVPRGAGVRLSVSTDDPSGRTLTVDVAPLGDGAIHVSVVPHPTAGVAIMSDSFGSSRDEAFYGFGGRHNALNQRGLAFSSFVEEENLPGINTTALPAAVLFPNGPPAAYYPQAQFISSRGYGFLLNQPQLARFRLDSDRPDAWSVAADGTSLDYVVVPGSPRQAIGSLTALTGRQPVPPAWALGPMLDRLVKNIGESESDYQSNVTADLANVGRYRLPLTAYRVEGWGFSAHDNDGLALHSFISFPEQHRVLAELRARGIHPLAYLRPWITPGAAPDRAGLTVHNANGQTYVTTGTTGQQIALLDFTNPGAVRFWQAEVTNVLDLGFDGFMQDFSEEVLYGMHFADGESGVTMHNRYPVIYMRATRQALAAYKRAHPRRTLWFFNRAGYSGMPGSAAYEGGNFPGDESTDWSQAAGLESLTPDMLGRAIGGAYGFGADIGGYYDYTTPPTTKELFLRWAEWAALSPIFRLHGSGRSGTHTPWSYDKQTVDAYRALSVLHEQAVPLILRLWRESEKTGIPPTRPLWLEFPGDPAAAAQQQEWMLGDDVLVAPVVTQGATARSVYFPAGCWRDPQTGVTERGPTSATIAAPLTQLPYFFRCGTRPFATRGVRARLPGRKMNQRSQAP